MAEIDLWANDPLPEDFGAHWGEELADSSPEKPAAEVVANGYDDSREAENLPWLVVAERRAKTVVRTAFIPEGVSTVLLEEPSGRLSIYCRKDLSGLEAFRSLSYSVHEEVSEGWHTSVPLNPNMAMVLRALLPKDVEISKELKLKLKAEAEEAVSPRAELSESGKHIHLDVPNVKYYRDLANKLDAYPVKGGYYRLLIDKALDLESLAACLLPDTGRAFPAIELDEAIFELNREPIPGFTGKIDELKDISPAVLNVVASDLQTWKQKKTNPKTMVDKLADLGITNLHELLFWLPRRYIDKSDPQDIMGLIEGESATIIGVVKSATLMPNNSGSKFRVETESGRSVDVIFWRQSWLKNKFPENSEVIVTGKFGWYRNQPNLSGASIDHSDEVALLPIVPIYNQSGTKGVSTKFLLSAIRELISRLGDFPLPPYLQAEGRPNYSDTLRELHFPTSLENCKQAVDDMAYYELVLMQVQLLANRSTEDKREGLQQRGGVSSYQQLAEESFPWPLTDSQREAVEFINESLASDEASRTLLNSDVGTGKTVVAQLAALRSVDSGYQAVLAAPTEVLARQLYSTFQKLVDGMASDQKPSYGLIVGGMPIQERNALKKGAKDGSLDVLIGTHSVLTGTIKYHNLGIVVIDEQQKFGANQRTDILETRTDGKMPDLLMQSATPIPRSTAQVFYGDMKMIALKGKPKGRKPIETFWTDEDPREVVANPFHEIWKDILEETKIGNQAFVVTPMVNESPKVDAASVENTFRALRAVFGKRVAMVHGQMKPEEQKKTMELFRDKSYDVIVASSVVEVGVDIPDATRVAILSAGRFGASSLHQIRGRVGRNDKQARCYLVDLGSTKSAQTRLQAMVDFTDGYEIAKVDLRTRGEGKIFSTSQSGASELVFASLALHAEKIPQAQGEAQKILDSAMATRALEDATERFASEKRLA